MFPILGGRLLKEEESTSKNRVWKVSNPWREAIEDSFRKKICNR